MKLFLLLLIAAKAYAHDSLPVSNFPPPIVAPSVYAIEAKEQIVIDGKLNETTWQHAPVINEFFRMEPRQGGKYLYETFVKVVFDKKKLYFGVFCKDSIGKKGIRVQDLRRDFIYGENDVFYLQLDPQNLKRYCMSFQCTPYGNQRDVQVFDDSFKDQDWDALWKVRTAITDSGWYAEFAIPFKSLRYDVSATDSLLSWGITFARLARRGYETTVFPAVPQSFSPYRMTYAAQLKGLKLPASSSNIRMQPYALYQYRSSSDVNGNKTARNDIKAGGEIKWAINPHAVLDVTFNTDFAQADVDRAVNNLTRFNVQFPERRQFFLENGGIYAGANVDGVKPFFSRTIGLSNSQFNAAPVPIDAGLRYTDRNQQRTLAALYVRQQATDMQGVGNFVVLRYLKNFGTQSNIGGMITHRLDEADAVKGFLQRNNTTFTVDGLIRPKDDFSIRYMMSASRNNTNDSIDHAGSVYIGYTPNNYYIGNVTKWVGKRYMPGMGFVFQNDVIHHNPGGYYIFRPKGKLGKLIRRYDPGVFVNYYQNASDFRFQSANLYIFPVWFIFQTGAKLTYSIYPTWEHFFFSPLGINVAPTKYFFIRHEVSYNTDASKKISAAITYTGGTYYDGRLQTINASGRLAPIPNISFTADYELNRIRDLGVQQVSRNIALWSIGTRMALNPRMLISGFYQYNAFNQQGRWNMRASWEFAPLSFLYVVFNDNNFQNSSLRDQSLISKITYLKQF